MKNCSKCKKNKELFEYTKDKQKKNGLSSYCKDCTRKRNSEFKKSYPYCIKESAKKYREKHREKIRKESNERYKKDKEKYLRIGRESYHRNKKEIAKRRKITRLNPEKKEKDRIRMKEWREKNKERFNLTVRKWQKKNREKTNAHARVHWAIDTGRLKRSESCEECGKKCKTEGHHEDYKKEFDVIWLCRQCHAKKIETIEV